MSLSVTPKETVSTNATNTYQIELGKIESKFIDYTSKENGLSLTKAEMDELKDFINTNITDENLKNQYLRYLVHLETRQANKNALRERYSTDWDNMGKNNLSLGERCSRMFETIRGKIKNYFNPPEDNDALNSIVAFDRYRGLGAVNTDIAVDATEIKRCNQYRIKEQFLSGVESPEYIDTVEIITH